MRVQLEAQRHIDGLPRLHSCDSRYELSNRLLRINRTLLVVLPVAQEGHYPADQREKLENIPFSIHIISYFESVLALIRKLIHSVFMLFKTTKQEKKILTLLALLVILGLIGLAFF